MNNPYLPVFCVRCKRPNPGGGRLCEECCRQGPEANPTASTRSDLAVEPTLARWSPIRVLLLVLLGSLVTWAGWVMVLNVGLHGLGDSLVQILELCGTAFVPFGLVAADLWQDEDRYTLYGYAAAGYNLFFGLLACIQFREVADPLDHNLLYILEAMFSGALLLTLWLYRASKRAEYEM